MRRATQQTSSSSALSSSGNSLSTAEMGRRAAVAAANIRRIRFLSVIGLIVSFYLIYDHFSPQKHSFCELGKVVSCAVVNKSKYSELLNVPVAIFGTGWFIVLLAMSIKALSEPTFLITAIFLWSILGVCFVFYLLFAEYVLKTICPFCTIVHILNFIILFFASRMYFSQSKETPSLVALIRGMRAWIIPCAILFLVPLVLFNVFDLRPSKTNSDHSSATEDTTVDLVSVLSCLRLKGVKMYGAPSCSHCEQQKSIIGQELFHKGVTFVNCDEFASICEKKNLKGYPTWIQEREGVELMRMDGVLEPIDLARDFGCDPNPNGKKENDTSSSSPAADSKNEEDAAAKKLTKKKDAEQLEN